MTYAEWDTEIGRVAHGLTRLGIGSGGRGRRPCCPTGSRWRRFSGPASASARSSSPFNWRGSGDDFAFAIENAEAKAFFYETRSENSALDALRATEFPVERRVRVGGAAGEGAAFEDLAGGTGERGPPRGSIRRPPA